jgi:hypothetical protein
MKWKVNAQTSVAGLVRMDHMVSQVLASGAAPRQSRGTNSITEHSKMRHGDMTWSCVGSVGDVCGSATASGARGERPRSSCATQTRMGDGVRHDFSWSRYYHARTATRSATWSTDAHEQRVYTERDKIMSRPQETYELLSSPRQLICCHSPSLSSATTARRCSH